MYSAVIYLKKGVPSEASLHTTARDCCASDSHVFLADAAHCTLHACSVLPQRTYFLHTNREIVPLHATRSVRGKRACCTAPRAMPPVAQSGGRRDKNVAPLSALNPDTLYSANEWIAGVAGGSVGVLGTLIRLELKQVSAGSNQATTAIGGKLELMGLFIPYPTPNTCQKCGPVPFQYPLPPPT